MKHNIDNFNGVSDFIISIVIVVAWVLIGTIVVIGYFTIETKGESVMLSFISTIFTVISSLGIAATIGVYFWQKNDMLKKQSEFDRRITPSIASNINSLHSDISTIISVFEKIQDYDVYIDDYNFIYTCISNKSLRILNPSLVEKTINLNKINNNESINKNIMGVSQHLYNLIRDLERCESELFAEVYTSTIIIDREFSNPYFFKSSTNYNEREKIKTIAQLNLLKIKLSELKESIKKYQVHSSQKEIKDAAP